MKSTRTRLRARLLDEVGVAVGRGHARARILAAAIDVFAEHGVATARVEDILLAADVSRRTFYQHFGDKHAVVCAIYELVLRHLGATFVTATMGATDPLAAISRALDEYFEIHRTDRDIVRALIEESLRADSPLFELRAKFRKQIAAAVEAILRATLPRPPDPFVAVALVSALEGISLELLANDITDRDIVRARTVIVDLVALVRKHGVG